MEDTLRGSASSVSISFSSETTDDHPSTSGCSSMHVTGHEFRKLKKEKVKAYIQQIKSMVPPSKERGKKTGTLKALQHVIDKLKNLKDNKDEAKFNSFDDSATGSVSQYSGSSIARSTEIQSKPQKETFMVAVTLDCRVESVDSSLLQYLGYPKDSWHGHLLTSFTSRKDIITVNNMLSKNESVFKRFTDPGGTVSQKEKVIYFRLRYYKHLNEGYGLKRPDKFCAFQASVTTQVLDAPTSEKERVDASGMKKTKHFILKCVPLHSAYIVGSMPKNFSFSTTHTLYCNLNYISNSAITLLGFLPQDLTGLSVFELYHPDDLPYLYTVYQRIVSSKGKAFKSEPYRMRTRNQNWVYVETEWSGSVNQWSKWFEHISGQHTVVRVPENPNVFDEENSKVYPILTEETQLQQQKLQRRIQDLLLQQTTSDDSAIITLPSKPSTSFDAATTAVTSAKETDNTADLEKNKAESKSKEALMTAGSFVEEVIRYQNDGNVSPAVSHSSSPQILFDSDTSITYEQLNYSYNIKRFLLSQPKTYHSDNSDKGDSKCTNLKDVKEVLDGKRPKLFAGDSDVCEDADFASVDIPILNPPSFGSSTKVLVSDQEPRETTSPPADEYFEDFIMHKELSQPSQVFSDGQNLYQPVALTPEVLRMHTKFQERLYVQQATSDSSLFELDRGRSSDNSGNSNVKRSKRHLPESGEQDTYSHPLKVPRFDDSYMSASSVQHPEQTTMSSSQTKPGGPYFNKQQSFYRPSFPLNMSYPKFPSQPGFQNIHNTTFPQYQQPKLGLYSQAIPVLPYDTAIHMTTNTTTPTATQMNYSSNTTANSLSNTYWPCYAQTGMSFMPTQLVGGTQLMGGFYQPMPGMFQTFATPIPYSTNLPSMTTNKTTGAMQDSTTLSSTMHLNPICPGMKGPITSSTMSKHESMKQPTKISESSGSTSSQEETSSSLLYLLETGSYNTSSSTPDDIENIRKNRRLPRDPFWLQSTNWSSNIRMKYTVPQKSMKRVLKEDNEKLNSLYQPKPLLEQLKDLKTHNAKMPVINEEDDFLIFFDQSTQLSNTRSNGEEEEDEKTSTLSPQEDDEDVDTEVVVFGSVTDEPQNKSGTSMMDTSRDNSEKTLEAESKDRNHSEKTESSDNDDDKSDSSSKNSSCLTPSDQRSNEEAGSSLKESDGASKESDSGSKESDNGSGEENKLPQRPSLEKIDYNSFHELFIPLTLRMNKKNKAERKLSKLPHWRIEADMNKKIEMNYQLSSKNLTNVLEADQRWMNNLEQPSLVQEQLQVLLNEINSQEHTDAVSILDASSSSSNSSSHKNSCSDATATTTIAITAVTDTASLPTKSSETETNDQNSNQESKNKVAFSEKKDSMNTQTVVSYERKESEEVASATKDLENVVKNLKEELPSCPQEISDVVMSSLQTHEPNDVVMLSSKNLDSTNIEMLVTRTVESTNVEKTHSLSKDSRNPSPTQTEDSENMPLVPSSTHIKTSSLLSTAEKCSSSTVISTIANSDSNKLTNTKEMDDVFERLFMTSSSAEEMSLF